MTESEDDIGPWPAADGPTSLPPSIPASNGGAAHVEEQQEQRAPEESVQKKQKKKKQKQEDQEQEPVTVEQEQLADRCHEVAQSLNFSNPTSRRQWRPPRARHTTEGIDPAYLETLTYRNGPIGAVYDWASHHQQNNAVLKQRKQQERTEAVHAAALKTLQSQQAANAAYNQWLALKRSEKVIQRITHRHTAWMGTLPTFEPVPVKLMTTREAGWQKSTTTEGVSASIARTKVMLTPGKIAAL